MLENLLGTRLKKKLLNILFRFPERSFSISELREMTETSLRQITDAMREFSRAQIVSAAAKKKQRYYRINPHFPLHDEIRDLAGDGEYDGEDQVAKQVLRIPNVRLAILSGIFTLHPQLPLDLLLVGDDINRLRLQKALGEIRKIVGEEVNFAILTTTEYEHRRMMNDRFVRDVLDYPHIILRNTLKY